MVHEELQEMDLCFLFHLSGIHSVVVWMRNALPWFGHVTTWSLGDGTVGGEFRMCGFAGGSMSPSGMLLELTGSPLFPLTPSVLMVNSVVSHLPIPASLPSSVAVLPCHNGLLTHWNYKQNKLLQWFASGYSVLSQQWKINSMYPIFWSGSGPSTRGSMTGHCPCWCPAWSSVNEHYSWSWNQYFPNCGRHHSQGSWQQFSWLPAFLKSGWTETAEPSS